MIFLSGIFAYIDFHSFGAALLYSSLLLPPIVAMIAGKRFLFYGILANVVHGIAFGIIRWTDVSNVYSFRPEDFYLFAFWGIMILLSILTCLPLHNRYENQDIS